MDEQNSVILYRVAEEILESLAFLFPLVDEEIQKKDYGLMWGASISFSGPFSGRLIIRASEAILPELVQNMLGLEGGEKISLDQQHDALKELLSIVCGNLLPALAGKDVIFNLDMPQLISPNEYNLLIKDKEPISHAKLSLENGRVEFLLFVEKDRISSNNRRSR